MFPTSSSSSTTSSSPSCFTTTTTTATSTSTVTTVAQSAIQSSSSERRKCTQKRKHCGPTSGEDSPAKKPCTSPRPGSPLPSTSSGSGYTFTPYEEREAPGPSRPASPPASKIGLQPRVRNALNPIFMQHMQADIYRAQQGLELIDMIAASMFQEQCDEVPDNVPGYEPNVMVLRQGGKPPIKLDWNKLTLALARLQKEAPEGGYGGEIGFLGARKAVRFLQLLYKRKHLGRLEQRYTSGQMFAHLCAQALSTQCTRVASTTPYPQLRISETLCFVSGDDIKAAIEDPGTIIQQPAIDLLRHRWSHDEPRKTKRRWKQAWDLERADYPLYQ